ILSPYTPLFRSFVIDRMLVAHDVVFHERDLLGGEPRGAVLPRSVRQVLRDEIHVFVTVVPPVVVGVLGPLPRFRLGAGPRRAAGVSGAGVGWVRIRGAVRGAALVELGLDRVLGAAGALRGVDLAVALRGPAGAVTAVAGAAGRGVAAVVHGDGLDQFVDGAGDPQRAPAAAQGRRHSRSSVTVLLRVVAELALQPGQEGLTGRRVVAHGRLHDLLRTLGQLRLRGLDRL